MRSKFARLMGFLSVLLLVIALVTMLSPEPALAQDEKEARNGKWVLADDSNWETISSGETFSAGGIVMSSTGVLYVLDTSPVDATHGGILRCANPTAPVSEIVWQRLNEGLPEGTTLDGLRITRRNVLWVWDSETCHVWTYRDTVITVDISVVLQGGGRPDEGWVVPITIKLFSPDSDVLNDTPVYEFNLTTAKSGDLAVCETGTILPDTSYDITVISEHTLMNVRRAVVISAPSTSVDLCTLLEGNANGDNIIDISDFGILALSFMEWEGNPGYDVRADFDRNGIIDIHDFGLLALNFMKYCPVACTD